MPPKPSETLSAVSTFPLGMSMNEALSKSNQTTSKVILVVTSTPESAVGPSPFALQDGPMIAPSGVEAAPVNREALRAAKVVSQTHAISGQPGVSLSPSDALQLSLENKLRLGLHGSPLCAVIWKPWITPWGASLWKPRARVGFNLEIAITLWPAATTPSGGQRNPPGTSLTGRRPDGTKATVTLGNVVVVVWSALRASDGAKGGPNMNFSGGGCPLPSQVSAAAKSSNAPTENGGLSLHPEFAGWEMRFPPGYLNCAFSVMPSTRTLRRPSLPLLRS